MTKHSIVSLSLFIIIVIANFVYWFRVIKWYSIRKAFPLNVAASKHQDIYLQFGKANIDGHHMRNNVFSGIMADGVVIRKPFPFSLFMPPIFIPWVEIEQVSLVSNIEGEPGSKMIKGISSLEYVKIDLKQFKEFLIIIPWQDIYVKNLPNQLTTNMGKGRA